MVTCLCALPSHGTVAFVPMAAPSSASKFVGSGAPIVLRSNARPTALRTKSSSTPGVDAELTAVPGTRVPKVVTMVDPTEAKRLAAEEWEVLQARSKLKVQRRIEATNGGWAMLGLTAGVVVEGFTGRGILLQVADYLDTLADFLNQFLPSPPT